MGLLGKITGLFKPVQDFVDEVHFSGEEKAEFKLKFAEAQIGTIGAILDLQRESLKLQADVIQAESKGGWLQRNWRPMLMVVFMFMLVNNFVLLPYAPVISSVFGLDGVIVPLEFPQGFWTLLTIGVGGYITSRGAEKILDKVNEAGGVTFGKGKK